MTLALPGLWLLLVAQSDPPPGYLDELLFSQNIDRAQGEYGHTEPFYYFLTYFPLDGLPWVALLPFAWSALGGRPEDRALRKRLAGWMILVVVFFSLSPGSGISTSSSPIRRSRCWWPRPGGISAKAGLDEVRKALLRFPLILLSILLVLFLASPGLPWLSGRIAESSVSWKDKALENLELVRTFPLGSAAVGLVIAIALLVTVRRLTKSQPDAPWRLGLTWAVFFATIGGVILPVLNDHKTPKELVPLVRNYVPAEGRLHFYRLNGENLALYTGKRGRNLRSHEELAVVLEETPAASLSSKTGCGTSCLRNSHGDSLRIPSASGESGSSPRIGATRERGVRMWRPRPIGTSGWGDFPRPAR